MYPIPISTMNLKHRRQALRHCRAWSTGGLIWPLEHHSEPKWINVNTFALMGCQIFQKNAARQLRISIGKYLSSKCQNILNFSCHSSKWNCVCRSENHRVYTVFTKNLFKFEISVVFAALCV